MMNWRCLVFNCLLYLSVFLIHVRSREISAEEVCRICDGCIYGSISCQEPGRLYMLPNDLPNGTQKVIIVSQRFDSQFLSQQNISSYTLHSATVRELTIMDCGLRAIEARTFHGLNSLTKLDISKNFLSRIQGHTFSSLRLNLLRLDDNQGLTLDLNAFQNLTVFSISMQNCGLRSLSYEVFQPLMQSGTLTTLLLTSNSLTTIESRFEPFFRTLSFLSLARNPFVCDCKLLWLSRILQRKRPTDNDDAFPLISHGRLLIVSDDDHPVCESPNYLRGKHVVSLTSGDFSCGPPQMRALEVDFSDFRVGYLDSLSKNGIVFIKCRAQGSPEMRLAWFRRDRCKNELTRLPGLKQVGPGIVEAPISYSLIVNNSKCEMDGTNEFFTCVGVDSHGNTSADLSLRWPTLPSLPPLLPSQKPGSLNFVEPSSSKAKFLHVEQEFSQSNPLDKLFFMKKFTILELIGAVVGTFTVTIFLFLLGYIFLYMRHRHQYPKSPSKTVYSFTTNTALPKFTDMQVHEFSSQYPVHGQLETIGNQSCDLTVDKRLLLPKTTGMETRRGHEARNCNSIYSECSGYDLPSNHGVNAPLPPVPPDPPPPSPPLLTTNQFGTVTGIPVAYPQPHTLNPATATIAAVTRNGCNNQSLAQTLTANAILVDMITNQRGKHQLQVTAPSREFRF